MIRQKFLTSLSAAAVAPAIARGAQSRRFEGLRVGVIGCGWCGKNDMEAGAHLYLQKPVAEGFAIHDAARCLLDVGWPNRIMSTGGVFVDPNSHANVPDKQTTHFEYENMTMTWRHRPRHTAPGAIPPPLPHPVATQPHNSA